MSFPQKLAILSVSLLPTGALADWNGWYVGASTGALSNGTFVLEGLDEGEIDDAVTFGGFWGQTVQNRNFAFGSEIAVLSAGEPTISSDREEVLANPIFDLKLRLGYIADEVLPYAIVGVSLLTVDGPSTEVFGAGLSYGAGIEYEIADQYMLGLEYLTRRTAGDYEATNGLSIATGDLEIEADTISLRLGIKF